MHWNSFSDFIAMGGYAPYVWGSFGVTALAMLLEPWLILRNRQKTLQRLTRQLRAENRVETR